jgi:hypothetical protein
MEVLSTGMDIEQVLSLTISLDMTLNGIKSLDPVLGTLQLRVHSCNSLLFHYQTDDEDAFHGFTITGKPPRSGKSLAGLTTLYSALRKLEKAVSKLKDIKGIDSADFKPEKPAPGWFSSLWTKAAPEVTLSALDEGIVEALKSLGVPLGMSLPEVEAHDSKIDEHLKELQEAFKGMSMEQKEAKESQQLAVQKAAQQMAAMEDRLSKEQKQVLESLALDWKEHAKEGQQQLLFSLEQVTSKVGVLQGKMSTMFEGLQLSGEQLLEAQKKAQEEAAKTAAKLQKGQLELHWGLQKLSSKLGMQQDNIFSFLKGEKVAQKEWRTGVEQKLHGMDAKLSSVQGGLSSVQGGLSSVQGGLNTVMSVQAQQTQALEQQAKALQEITRLQKEHFAAILEAAKSGVKDKGADKRQEELEAKQKELDAMKQKLETLAAQHDADLKLHEADVTQHEADVAALKAALGEKKDPKTEAELAATKTALAAANAELEKLKKAGEKKEEVEKKIESLQGMSTGLANSIYCFSQSKYKHDHPLTYTVAPLTGGVCDACLKLQPSSGKQNAVGVGGVGYWHCVMCNGGYDECKECFKKTLSSGQDGSFVTSRAAVGANFYCGQNVGVTGYAGGHCSGKVQCEGFCGNSRSFGCNCKLCSKMDVACYGASFTFKH